MDSQKARCYQGSPPSAAGRVKRWIGSGKLRRRFTLSDIALTYNNTNILFFLHPKLENFNSASKFPTPNTLTPFLNIDFRWILLHFLCVFFAFSKGNLLLLLTIHYSFSYTSQTAHYKRHTIDSCSTCFATVLPTAVEVNPDRSDCKTKDNFN